MERATLLVTGRGRRLPDAGTHLHPAAESAVRAGEPPGLPLERSFSLGLAQTTAFHDSSPASYRLEALQVSRTRLRAGYVEASIRGRVRRD